VHCVLQDELSWIEHRFETRVPLGPEYQRSVLHQLLRAEQLEAVLAEKYPASKRCACAHVISLNLTLTCLNCFCLCGKVIHPCGVHFQRGGALHHCRGLEAFPYHLPMALNTMTTSDACYIHVIWHHLTRSE